MGNSGGIMQKLIFHCKCGHVLEGFPYEAIKCPMCGIKMRAWVTTEVFHDLISETYTLDEEPKDGITPWGYRE
jgi:hypothetical protein